VSRNKQLIVLALVLAIGASVFLFLILNPDRYTALAIKYGSSAPYAINGTKFGFFYGNLPVLGYFYGTPYPNLYLSTNFPNFQGKT